MGIKLDKFFNKFDQYIGNISAVLMLLMMVNVVIDVILRYFFHTGSIGLQEMEWHLFSVMFLIGISYALNDEAHVRVDFIYDNMSTKRKAWVNILGTIFMLVPFALFIAYTSYDFVLDAYITNEISEDPGGLTHRWMIKAMIPLAFVLLLISAIAYIRQNISKLKAK